MKNDKGIDVRLPDEMKRRWMAAAKEKGYSGVSDFIRDTMEVVHFPITVDVIEPITPEPIVRPDPFVNSTKAEGAFCPNSAFHRKGVFCKSCKKVI